MTNGGLPGTGSQMGDTASVFEAICQICDNLHHPDTGWPATPDEQQRLVAFTRKVLGFDWTRRATCYLDAHNEQ